MIEKWDRYLDTKTIKVDYIEENIFFNKKNFKIKIEEYNNILSLKMKIKLPEDFPFPINSDYNDTLYETEYILKFYSNGKAIIINENFAKSYKNNWTLDNKNLTLFLAPDNQKHGYFKQIDIPLFVFHHLKKGEQNIVMELSQSSFCAEHFNEDSTYHGEILKKDTTIIQGKIKFEINIPEIFRTDIYSNSIVLRDDEDFSPVGMDFSFRKGYPDIYMQVFYPVKNSKDYINGYYTSDIQDYAVERTRKDTIILFHYYVEDEIMLGVYDYDVLSRDDFLGEWFGKLTSLSENNDLSFDNIKKYKIRIEKLKK